MIDGLAPEYTASIDHWPEIEIDQLRDDLECAELAQEKAEKKMLATMVVARRNKRDYVALQKTMADKIAESNGELTNKSMIYLSLINEYEIVLGSIMEKYRVSLTTTAISNLRKRGGLVP
jgi:hypothetical protein